MEIHQILVSASPGDAVTNASFELRDLLRRIGPSEIFARYIHDELTDEVRRLDSYAEWPSAAREENLLIYHASIGEPAVVSFLLERRERLVLVYHNITPARYFATLDPPFAELLAGGRLELAALRDRVDLALADSAYNAAELEALGYPDVRVSRIVIDVNWLRQIEPSPTMVTHLEKYLHGPLILFVGQLLPHKRPDLLLQAYHVLVTHHLPDAYLALVGPTPSARYRFAVETYIRQLNLNRAMLPGRVPAADLAAFYRASSAFLTVSEHEGFCVPLVEAMAYEVPVVARDFGAVAETLGGSGLLLPSEDDPFLVAEAMSRLLTDEVLRKELVTAGTRRLADFDPDVARATFLAHLADVA